MTVGYYVHHAGAGHGALGAALSAVTDLVGLGSGGRPPGWRGRWVDLPPDDDPPVTGDPTRGGAWHWAPPGHPGFAARMRRLATWIAEEQPAALVSDVSCEVTVLGGLLGVPTVAVVLAGRRDDPPHRLAFATADARVAPWPADGAGVTSIGLVSRFDPRPSPPTPSGREVLVLLPSGAHGLAPHAIEAAAAATPGWRWTVTAPAPVTAAAPTEPVIGSVGKPTDPITGSRGVRWVGRVEDPWPRLGAATVVVAPAGLGSVSDIAAARRPAVLLPQPRPFDEQRALAASLTGAPVVVADRWPAADDWPGLLGRAAALDPARWDAVHDRRGAARFAAVLARVSGREAPASERGCSPTSPARSGPPPTPPDGPSPATSTPTWSSSAAASPG